jgi:CDP-diacylglycerol---glycerol-3-phosphate 3-phosphatidyltransferase
VTTERSGAADASIVSPAMRDRVRALATPIARGLGRLGLTPNALTVIGFLGTCVAAIAAAGQAWLVAGILVLAFGIFDLFDGTLARATGRATRLGAFLDSTFDRAGEAVVYIGIAAGSLAGGFELGAVLAASAMAAAFMVSYSRAKAESLGFSSGSGLANVGLAPREVRLALLAGGLIFTALAGPLTVAAPCSETAPGALTCIYPFYSSLPLTGSAILATTLGLITFLATLTTLQRVFHVAAQSKEG